MRKWTSSLIFLIGLSAGAQDSIGVPLSATYPVQKEINSAARKWLAGSASAVGYGGSFVFLNEAWYKNYPRGPFRTFDDSGEWMQMDKAGHVWTTYHTSRVNTAVWKWAGVKPSGAVLLGTATSLAYMLSIEYLDGRSTTWGWSWADAGANLVGAALFASQELGWKEQRIVVKFSSHRKGYDAGLDQRADGLFGKSLPERLLKDYNAQTYWISANLSSLLQTKKLPAWLNIAVGYGADNMFGGYENIATDKNGNITFDRRDLKRYRQWYLSPDIDLTRIPTRSRLLRSVLFVLNAVKIPAPALELSNGKLQVRGIVF